MFEMAPRSVVYNINLNNFENILNLNNNKMTYINVF
jgi:hypothetical protein